MSFKDIRKVTQDVWPAVRESLDIVREKREAIKKNPEGASPAALTRARRPWNKVVCEETVWAIAKADLLITDRERAVLEAAKDWYFAWGGLGPKSDEEDYELYLTVEKLLTPSE